MKDFHKHEYSLVLCLQYKGIIEVISLGLGSYPIGRQALSELTKYLIFNCVNTWAIGLNGHPTKTRWRSPINNP